MVVDSNKIKSILTSHVAVVLDESVIVDNLNTLYAFITASAMRFAVKHRLSLREPSDLVRFALKGGTAQLLMLRAIQEKDNTVPSEIPEIVGQWDKSDWDTTMVVDPIELPLHPHLYYELYADIMRSMIAAFGIYERRVNQYLETNRGIFNFEWSRAQIESVFPAHTSIARVTAKLSKSSSNRISVRDQLGVASRDRIFRDTGETLISQQLEVKAQQEIIHMIQTRYGISNRVFDEPNPLLGGVIRDISWRQNGCFHMSLNSTIRTERDGSKIEKSFDLWRNLVRYRIYVVFNDGRKEIINGNSEWIDASFVFPTAPDALDLWNELGFRSRIVDALGNIPFTFPIADLDFAIGDMIHILDQPNPLKKEKRCKRLRTLLKLKCSQERSIYIPMNDRVVQGCGDTISPSIDEKTCHDLYGSPWSSCGNTSKYNIIQWLMEHIPFLKRWFSEEDLDRLAKTTLCAVTQRYQEWSRTAKGLERALGAVIAKMIFSLLSSEQRSEQILSPFGFNLPENFGNVLLAKHLVPFPLLREFIVSVKEDVSVACEYILAQVDRSLFEQRVGALYVLGGSVFELYRKYLPSFPSYIPPSPDYDVNIVLVDENPNVLEWLTNSLVRAFMGLSIDDPPLYSRYQLLDPRAVPDFKENWDWKYYSNTNDTEPEHLLKDPAGALVANKHFFVTLTRRFEPNQPYSRYVFRLNVLVQDVEIQHVFTDHIVEILIATHEILDISTVFRLQGLTMLNPSAMFTNTLGAFVNRYAAKYKYKNDRIRLRALLEYHSRYPFLTPHQVEQAKAIETLREFTELDRAEEAMRSEIERQLAVPIRMALDDMDLMEVDVDG